MQLFYSTACAISVTDRSNFIIERDKEDYFKFAPLQSGIGQELLNKHGINKTETDSVILIENETGFHAFNRRFESRPKTRRRVVLVLRIHHNSEIHARFFLQTFRQKPL